MQLSEVSTATSVPPPIGGQLDIIRTTETHGRKAKRRMRSRFQKGTLQKAGNWVLVRFRLDTFEGRMLAHEKVCPIVGGKPTLSLAEQRRKAAEIIQAAGVNNHTQIKQTVYGLTFAEQAEKFLEQSKKRRRKPISQSTYDNWRLCIDKWLTPNIGGLLLSEVNNATLKSLVIKMCDAGLSAKTVNTYTGLVKLVVASAIDANGEELYPRKWNHEFVEMPIIEDQHRPTFTAAQITQILKRLEGQNRMAIILAAATGLRLGELLGLTVEDVTGNTITVRQQAYRGRITDKLKTRNAYRAVDIHSSVAKELKDHIGNRTTGLLFPTSTGTAQNSSNFRNRVLYPILEELGIAQAGPHALRRFRATQLRQQRTPEALVKAWLGHSATTSITDLYDRSSLDVVYRRKEVEKAGIGFDIPAIVQNVQKHQKEQVTLAA